MQDDDERRRSIAELRQCSRQLLDRLSTSGEALLVLSCGVVVVNESYAYSRRLHDFSAPIDDRFIRCTYALCHEAVHMVQLLSTRFVLGIAMEFSELCARVSAGLKSDIPEARWLPPVLQDYREARRQFGEPRQGFSTLQVIETHAVIEGFRGGFSNHTLEALVHVVRIAHGEDSDYADVIGRLLSAFGFEFTLEVVPKLCWLALQTAEPGQSFTRSLLSLADSEVEPMIAWSASKLCTVFGMDPAELGRSMRVRVPGVRGHFLHALFEGYFDALEREDRTEPFLQLAMHPGRTSGSDIRVRMADLMPPLTVFNDDGYQLHGPYRDKGWAAAEPLIRISTLATQRLEWLDEKAGEPADSPP